MLRRVCKLWSQKQCYRYAISSFDFYPERLLSYEYIESLKCGFWDLQWQAYLHNFQKLKSLSINLDWGGEIICLTMLPSCTSLVISSIRSQSIIFPPNVQYLFLERYPLSEGGCVSFFQDALKELTELYLDGCVLLFNAKAVPKLEKIVFVNVNFHRILPLPTFPSTCDITLWGFCSYPEHSDFPWHQVSTLVLSNSYFSKIFERLPLLLLHTLVVHSLPTVPVRFIPPSVQCLIIGECGDVEEEVFALPQLKHIVDARSASKKGHVLLPTTRKWKMTQLNIVDALRDLRGLSTTLNWNLYSKFGSLFWPGFEKKRKK
jgi:hypothetical protein